MDQFCQQILDSTGLKVLSCYQDFVNAYLGFASPLSPADQATVLALAAAHTAVGRITVGTVAALADGLFENEDGFATNGRKVGEGPGAGTGVPIYWSTGSWRVLSDDTPVSS